MMVIMYLSEQVGEANTGRSNERMLFHGQCLCIVCSIQVFDG